MADQQRPTEGVDLRRRAKPPGFAASVAITALVAACSGGGADQPPPATPNRWEHVTAVDKMTDKQWSLVCGKAVEPVELQFPYETQVPELCVSSDGFAYINLPKGGQFLCSPTEYCHPTIRLDASTMQEVTAWTPHDGSTNRLFLSLGDDILQKLRTTKRILISAEFYQDGTRVMEWSVDQQAIGTVVKQVSTAGSAGS